MTDEVKNTGQRNAPQHDSYYYARRGIFLPIYAFLLLVGIRVFLGFSGLGGLALLPIAVPLIVLLYLLGLFGGVMSGMTAIRLSKELPPDKRQRVLHDAKLGIALGIATGVVPIAYGYMI